MAKRPEESGVTFYDFQVGVADAGQEDADEGFAGL